MDRTYGETPPEKVYRFFGKEVEGTKFYDQDTMFVVLSQTPTIYNDPHEIIAELAKRSISHVYLGANHSMNMMAIQDIFAVLRDTNINVTIEVPSCIADLMMNYLQFKGFTTDRLAVIMSIRGGHTEIMQEVTYVKLDDQDFDKTTSGVYVIGYDEIMKRAVKTERSEYKNDTF